MNSVAYHPELDQIVLSVLGFSEIWIIDHGTTTAEAAGHTGGRSGKGGDLLYRWGNPRAYRAGSAVDQSSSHSTPPIGSARGFRVPDTCCYSTMALVGASRISRLWMSSSPLLIRRDGTITSQE